MIITAHTTPTPNIYERRTQVTLKPLMLEKIKYHKLKKDYSMNQI